MGHGHMRITAGQASGKTKGATRPAQGGKG